MVDRSKEFVLFFDYEVQKIIQQIRMGNLKAVNNWKETWQGQSGKKPVQIVNFSYLSLDKTARNAKETYIVIMTAERAILEGEWNALIKRIFPDPNLLDAYNLQKFRTKQKRGENSKLIDTEPFKKSPGVWKTVSELKVSPESNHDIIGFKFALI